MSITTDMLSLLPRIANHKLARWGLLRPAAPINLTLSVTNRCDSRCRTCGIWRVYRERRNGAFPHPIYDKEPGHYWREEELDVDDELTLEEIQRFFSSVGRVFFFNVSGGEPFLRDDLADIVLAARERLSPRAIHVPTNGLRPDRIEATVKEILERLEKSGFRGTFSIKPSLDGVGDKHDHIRGTPGNFDKVLDLTRRLLTLKKTRPALEVGLGTVISKFNVEDVEEIAELVESLNVDSYIHEIAETRSEMFDQEEGVTPDWKRYQSVVERFKESTRATLGEKRGLTRVAQAFRVVYYDLVVETLKRETQIVPCQAGYSNAHVNPYGDVWSCCVLGYERSMGSLREHDYDFMKIWRSNQAAELRHFIKCGNCSCPLANQNYANLLYHPPSMLKVLFELSKAK